MKTLDLSPQNAHPMARGYLQDDFFWDFYDDNSPLGNDTGADIFHHYQKWKIKNPQTNPIIFLEKIFISWELENKDWDLLEESKLRQKLERDTYNVLIRDDSVIAIAFSQIILEGNLNKKIRELALLAIKRQMSDIVINFRNWTDKQERRERLTKMQSVLQNFNKQIKINKPQ